MRYDQVEGINPIAEIFRLGGKSVELLVANERRAEPRIASLVGAAEKSGVPVKYMPRKEIDSASLSEKSQGVILKTKAYEYIDMKGLITKSLKKNNPIIAVIDGVEDPGNLGNIFRSAAAFGISGMILKKHSASPVTPTVYRVSTGACDAIPTHLAPNISKALTVLKKAGFWVVGTDAEAADSFGKAEIPFPCALVLGSEMKGISRLVKDHCDMILKIHVEGIISQLNVASAAAVAFYEARRNHPIS